MEASVASNRPTTEHTAFSFPTMTIKTQVDAEPFVEEPAKQQALFRALELFRLMPAHLVSAEFQFNSDGIGSTLNLNYPSISVAVWREEVRQ